MNKQDPKTMNIKFRKVYLSDLNAIKSIYKKWSKEPATEKLTAHFGLPLSIATENNKIIGFASASVNELDEIKLNAHGENVSDDLYIEKGLEKQAEIVLSATFKNITEDQSQLKNSINQLVDWLNKCAV